MMARHKSTISDKTFPEGKGSPSLCLWNSPRSELFSDNSDTVCSIRRFSVLALIYINVSKSAAKVRISNRNTKGKNIFLFVLERKCFLESLSNLLITLCLSQIGPNKNPSFTGGVGSVYDYAAIALSLSFS